MAAVQKFLSVVCQTTAQVLGVFLDFPPRHKSRRANWYVVLIESDSTLSQHPSGHLATVTPWLLAQPPTLTLPRWARGHGRVEKCS